MARSNRFDQLIDHWDPILRRAFLTSVYQLRDQAQIEQIARMVERGNVDGAVRAVGLDPASFRAFDRAISDAFEAGGDAVIRGLPVARDVDGGRLTMQFGVRNNPAEAWLRDHSSTLITQIVDDQRVMLRGALEVAMSRGLNPRTTALDLVGRIGATGRREGGLIGLTSSQAEWVRGYAAELASENPEQALTRALRDRRFDAAVRRAARTGEPIQADLRAKMVMAYKNRALRYRAETIARTEAMASLHQSQEEAMKQAVESGVIQQSTVTFVWHTARDERVRDSHRAMEGQTRAWGRPFETGNGARLRYPGDPMGPAAEVIQCRCWREPVVDFLAAAVG